MNQPPRGSGTGERDDFERLLHALPDPDARCHECPGAPKHSYAEEHLGADEIEDSRLDREALDRIAGTIEQQQARSEELGAAVVRFVEAYRGTDTHYSLDEETDAFVKLAELVALNQNPPNPRSTP